MGVEIFYRRAPGRALLKALQKTGSMRAAAWFLRTRASRIMIRRYIRKHGIDMTPYHGQRYRSFAQFFARRLQDKPCTLAEGTLISPSDGLLSLYPIEADMSLPMKGSHYRLQDLIPEEEAAATFAGGLCIIVRLEASDYHHFCYVDDGIKHETHYIPGQLHSVQPIAIETVPVYRLNRRWWTLLDTDHFGPMAQIEIGAVLVGGITHCLDQGRFARGEEMGNFELRGSTIVLLTTREMRSRFAIAENCLPAWNDATEVRLKMGDPIGTLSAE